MSTEQRNRIVAAEKAYYAAHRTHRLNGSSANYRGMESAFDEVARRNS